MSKLCALLGVLSLLYVVHCWRTTPLLSRDLGKGTMTTSLSSRTVRISNLNVSNFRSSFALRANCGIDPDRVFGPNGEDFVWDAMRSDAIEGYLPPNSMLWK